MFRTINIGKPRGYAYALAVVGGVLAPLVGPR